MAVVIQNLRKLGWTEFKRRWKEGIMRLTPLQLLQGEVRSYAYSVFATMAAGVVFVIMGLWPILIFLVFNIAIQAINFIQKYQQLQIMKKMGDFESMSEILKEEDTK